MQKYVPIAKRSKKEQRKINSEKRGSWYGLNPVTRIVPDKKTKYSRKSKHKNRAFSDWGGSFLLESRQIQAN